MHTPMIYEESESGLSPGQLRSTVLRALQEVDGPLRSVLFIVPDYTRRDSWAGEIANICYHALQPHCRTDFLQALGTHRPMTEAERADMYGDIPADCFFAHDWRGDTVRLGMIPAECVAAFTDGRLGEAIAVDINRRVVSSEYDLIVSIGQVVPHEVAGMSSYSKNLFVGVGGESMIHNSHLAGAFCGMERILGHDHTPARELFDYALQTFLPKRRILFMHTVADRRESGPILYGLYIGFERDGYEKAIALSQKKNIIHVHTPFRKVVASLDPAEFHSVWVGNKAVHRLKLAMAQGGELIIHAPGVCAFAEDATSDALIRQYGYCGRERIIALRKQERALSENLAVVAHLMHGSTEGRFIVTYCAEQMSPGDIEKAGYRAMLPAEFAAQYPVDRMTPGYQRLANGETVYYVPNPALGLWVAGDAASNA